MTDSASHDVSDKPGRLRGTGTLNPHPERVRDPRFARSDFFDGRIPDFPEQCVGKDGL